MDVLLAVNRSGRVSCLSNRTATRERKQGKNGAAPTGPCANDLRPPDGRILLIGDTGRQETLRHVRL